MVNFLFTNGPLSGWILANLALFCIIGIGLLEYKILGRQEKEREEARANQWISYAQDKVKKKRILIMLKDVLAKKREHTE